MDKLLELRPVAESDLPTIYRLTNDPDATGEYEWFGWQDRWRYHRRWEQNGLLDDDGGMLMVHRGDEILGFVAWSKRVTARTSFCWNMGIALLPEARGRGYGTDAQRQLVRYLFAHTQVNRIEAGTNVDNIAEQRALEKLGFTREGVTRGAAFQGGRWQDGVIYSLVRADVERLLQRSVESGLSCHKTDSLSRLSTKAQHRRSTAMSQARVERELVVPEGGFWPAPEIPQPNIYPMEWRVETEKLAAIYQKSKLALWNPAELPWDGLRAEDFTIEQRLGIMYWFAVLANFDASGPAVFARATIRAFEQHEEDPVRKCFFSITRDEMNHEECCQRSIAALWPGGPLNWTPTTDLERAAHNNIAWLYHNGGRYWNGYNKAVGRYSLPVLFTSFMMGEMAASTLFRGMASGTTHPVFSEMFHKIGRDESRHLQICMTILENEWPGLTDDVRMTITRQLRAGFIFLSMILWEPPEGFWELPPYFLQNHRVLMDHARDAGLGVLSYEQQAENWRSAIAKIRVIVQRWGIEFPAMPELDIEGVDVSADISAEDIIPVF